MALLDFVWVYPGEPAPERKNQSGITGARDSEWHWHQLGHMQICTLTQTQPHQHPTTQFFTGLMPFQPPNHTHTTHNRFTAGLEYVRVHPGQQVPESHPTNSVKTLKAKLTT